MSKVISVRLSDELFTWVFTHDLSTKDLITKALSQFKRSKEPNKKVDEWTQPSVNNPYTKEYVGLIHTELDYYRNRCQDLERKNESLYFANLPWYKQQRYIKAQTKLLKEPVSPDPTVTPI